MLVRVVDGVVEEGWEQKSEASHNHNDWTGLQNSLKSCWVSVRRSLHNLFKLLMSDDIDIEKLKSEIKDDHKKKLILTTIFITGFLGFVTLLKFSPQLTEYNFMTMEVTNSLDCLVILDT
jgi:hypothetical protein